jgi:anti-anti-sigma factor
MDLSYTDVDGVRTVKLKGRMDLQGAAEIDLPFTALTSTERSYIVIDLSEVDFMASMGLATLVRSGKAVRLRKGNMVLFNPTPSVRQVLASTRVDEVLRVYSDLEVACTAARTPAVSG